MEGIRIIGTGHEVPKYHMTNDDISKIVDTSDEWIRTRTGIEARYFSKDEKNWELAAEAARKAIKEAKIKPDQIGACIVATMTSDYYTPSMACMIQKELGLRENILSFDINAACSGFVYGLNIASAMMANIESPYILLIGSEQLSRIADRDDRGTFILFGDGAGAVIIKKDSNVKTYSSVGSSGDNKALVANSVGRGKQVLSMDGKEIFRFAVSIIPKVIDELLEKAGYTMDDIDYVVCHQANERIIKNVENKYKITRDIFYVNVQKYGNTSAASIPIVLDEMWHKEMLKPGTKIICVGFGGGLTWGGTLLEF